MSKARLLRGVLLWLSVAGALIAGAGWGWMRAQFSESLPDFASVMTRHISSETLIVSREGQLLHRLRSNKQERRGQWLALSDISVALRDAVLASEDRRFYQHGGVDWRALWVASWNHIWHAQRRGASTVTMQLVGLLASSEIERLRVGVGQRSWRQKLWQIAAAQALETHWSKNQILEAYLNLAPFRSELVGVDALSRTLFDKAAHGLTRHEAALAAALLRAPNAAPARVAQRACAVLAALDDAIHPAPARHDCVTLRAMADQALNARRWSASAGLTPHLARRVGQGSVRPSITTTLSAPLQDYAARSLYQHLRELRDAQVEDGAILVLDNATGAVLAWVGSSGELSTAAEVDAITAPRQPGSTLKPFLYAQAIAENRLTAASLLDDSATTLATGHGLYNPQNYDRRFQGWVSVRTALAASLNIPAVRTLVMVTPDAFFAQLQRLGLKLAETGGYHGYSLALGSAEVSLLNLTNAYRTLANGGRWTPVHWTPPVSELPDIDPPSVIDARATFIVADILSDNQARAATFGLDSVLATPFWTAVKTGTSKDMRDNWAVGWSRHYTVGVWVGNASGVPMHAVSGTDGAAPIWADVMRYLHQDMPSHAPTAPTGVVVQKVQFGVPTSGTSLEATRHEWFIAGTEQMHFVIPSSAHADTNLLRIAQPVDGTIFASDPDIPLAHQRIALRARSPGQGSAENRTGLRWYVRSAARLQSIGEGDQTGWLPVPGRHQIELHNDQGRVLDSVRVEVRDAARR